MFGMCKRLKLARARIVPFKRFYFQSLFENLRQELRLWGKKFRFQSGLFTGLFNRVEIDVRGQILFADVCQDVIGGMMTKIGAERAVGSSGRKHFVGGEAVIN